MTARVGLVDDHPALLLGATRMLDEQPDLSVVATAATVPELLSSGTPIDLVLLDLSLGDGSSVAENVARLHAAGIVVVAYTSAEQPAMLRRAARAGATAVVRKTEGPEAIAETVRAVLAGEEPAGADWAAALEHDEGFVSAQLTAREREVLALYAAGETAERVAAELYISRETVTDHIRRIRGKYSAVHRPAHTKVDLYRRALEDGLVDEA